MNKPPLLFPTVLPGDVIGVMAPSSYVEESDIQASKAALEALGYKVHIHPQTFLKAGQMAGTDAEKTAALHELFMTSEIKAIWCAGGGNRSTRLLDKLDYELIAQNPKALLGFSDNTAPLNGIAARTGLITCHTEVFKNLHKHSDLAALLRVLNHKETRIAFKREQTMNLKAFKGRLLGGNLSVFHYLAGTIDCPDLEGAVLFLEDCGEELSRLDRMLIHLERCAVFEKISGLLLGSFNDIKDSGRPFADNFIEIIKDYTDPRKIPVIFNLGFGHQGHDFSIPINGLADYESDGLILSVRDE